MGKVAARRMFLVLDRALYTEPSSVPYHVANTDPVTIHARTNSQTWTVTPSFVTCVGHSLSSATELERLPSSQEPCPSLHTVHILAASQSKVLAYTQLCFETDLVLYHERMVKMEI
jgi:hypothetical protein